MNGEQEVKEKDKDKDDFRDFEKLLENLLENHYKYFTLPEYVKPTTRHEAWFLCSCYTNLLLLEEIKGLRKDLKGVK